ncbi:hypothetical protein C8R44DRAFT_750585 [Mycena epipterygia]|nr:hypothetical protein C8R44DRAFT_750585 [Mycena epipterygia]
MYDTLPKSTAAFMILRLIRAFVFWCAALQPIQLPPPSDLCNPELLRSMSGWVLWKTNMKSCEANHAQNKGVGRDETSMLRGKPKKASGSGRYLKQQISRQLRALQADIGEEKTRKHVYSSSGGGQEDKDDHD